MLGNPGCFVKVGIRCTIQRYQGKHKNEFLLQLEAKIAHLLLCILVQQEWKEDKNGNKSDKFIIYKNGRADFLYYLSIFYNNRIIYVLFITREDIASNSKRSIPYFHYSLSQYYFCWNTIP